MKKTVLFLLFSGLSLSVFAQKLNPVIKDGTTMNADVFAQGQVFPLTLKLKSVKAPITLIWSVDGYGDGEFVMNEKALENGTSLFIDRPNPGTTKLGDSETYGLISKKAFKSLVENKSFTYNDIKFNLKTPDANPVKIGGKEVDAFRVSAEGSNLEFWILNNPDLPLILQTAGMPIDTSITEIK